MVHFLTALAFAVAQIAPVQPNTVNRQPQLAVAGKRVAVVFGNSGSIWLANSYDTGRTFSPPRKVAELTAVALGRHRGPRVAFSGRTIVVSAVAEHTTAAGPDAQGSPQAENLLAWNSSDDGKTWSNPAIVNDTPRSAREGLHAMASDAQGNVAAVWLDLRSQGTRLYGAVSRDAGRSWSPNRLLAAPQEKTLCECCAPSVVSLRTSDFAFMFRNSIGGNRDMYWGRWQIDGAVSESQKLGQGTWKINACPMDGGGIAVQDHRVVSAWRRGQDVFEATAGGPERRVAHGKDVTLAAAKQRAYACWSNESGIECDVNSQQIHLSSSGSFPNIAAFANGWAIAAWEQNNGIRIAKIDR